MKENLKSLQIMKPRQISSGLISRGCVGLVAPWSPGSLKTLQDVPRRFKTAQEGSRQPTCFSWFHLCSLIFIYAHLISFNYIYSPYFIFGVFFGAGKKFKVHPAEFLISQLLISPRHFLTEAPRHFFISLDIFPNYALPNS